MSKQKDQMLEVLAQFKEHQRKEELRRKRAIKENKKHEAKAKVKQAQDKIRKAEEAKQQKRDLQRTLKAHGLTLAKAIEIAKLVKDYMPKPKPRVQYVTQTIEVTARDPLADAIREQVERERYAYHDGRCGDIPPNTYRGFRD